jgi:hypothetical protein
VRGLTDAPVPWPYRKSRAGHAAILCGDLVEAVRVETDAVLCHLFRVPGVTVAKWRWALAIPAAGPPADPETPEPKSARPSRSAFAARVLSLYRRGMSQAEIARPVGRHRHQVPRSVR